MTKQQLIEKVAAKTELKKSEVEVAVDSVLELIAETLGANERVDLRTRVADKLNRAMPHVRSMLTAMRDRDRTTALAHGETTLRRL